jgi:hypothetical protein
MTIEFKPAVRENVSLLIALAGASGSGKTYSALRLAIGMAPSGKIAMIDTEARRGLHYADAFRFMHFDMRPPFKPPLFVEAVQAAEGQGAEVVIIDSMSQEYDGPGGLIEWADELERLGTKSPGNWKAPKMAHRHMMGAFLQSRASLIFCLRADEKIKIEKIFDERKGRDVTAVVPLGWTPICEKRMMYEMTASFTLTPDKPGKPNFALPHKLQEQHRPMFPEGQPIDEAAGRALAEWARGGAVAITAPPTGAPPGTFFDEATSHYSNVKALAGPSLEQQGHECAERGMAVLGEFWAKLTPSEKKAVGGAAQLDSWKRIAADADTARPAREPGEEG